MTRLPLRALGIGTLFAAIFAYVAIVSANRGGPLLPSTQIASIAILFCLALVLLLNPALRWLRLRVFSRREIFLVFIMATVPAGLPVFGYICEVVPLIGGLHHPEWNTTQSQWNEQVVPHLDPALFLGAPLFQEADVRDWRAFNAGLQAAGTEADGRPSPSRRLWALMAEPVHLAVARAAAGEPFEADAASKALRAHAAKAAGGTFTEEQQEQLAHALSQVIDAWRRGASPSLALREPPVRLAAWEVEMILGKEARTDRAAIVFAITAALERRDFYVAEEFSGVTLPAEAAELASRPRDKLTLDEVRRLNRYVLEASFPDAIRSGKFLRDQWAVQDYVRGMQARNREAWPVFLKKPEETWGEFWGRLRRYATVKPAFDAGEIKKWWQFYPTLAQAGTDKAAPAQARVWNRLPEEVRSLV